MSKLRLTLACGDLDRTRALWDGRVSPEGIVLTYVPLIPEEVFWRMLQYTEFDISEMSLSNYLTERCKSHPRFIAIPVFPSRMFRHGFIFINKKSGIKDVSKYSYNKSSTYYVGDRTLDVDCANNAGIKSVFFNPEGLKYDEADYNIYDLMQLTKIINNEKRP